MERNLDINWGGNGYPEYPGFLNTAVTPAAPTVPPAGGAPSTSAETAPPAGGSIPASPTGTPTKDDNLRVLREGYEQSQKWGKLGEFDKVSSGFERITKLYTEAEGLAKKLNYAAEDVQKAFESDPVKTLHILRTEAAKHAKENRGSEKIEELISKRVEEATKPLTERFQAEEATKVITAIGNEAGTLIHGDFPKLQEEAPEAFNLLHDMVTVLLRDQMDEKPELRKAMFEGKLASVKAAYSEAKDIFQRGYTAFQKFQTKGKPSAGGNEDGAERPKVSLDDIVNATPAAAKAIKSFR